MLIKFKLILKKLLRYRRSNTEAFHTITRFYSYLPVYIIAESM